MDLAFYGRVSTEDAQDPEASREWQIRRALDCVRSLGHAVSVEFFDIGQSRSIPWKRRPQAAELLAEAARADRRFDGVVVGEPQRAFYGNQFSLTFPLLTHHGVSLFIPDVGGLVEPDSDLHEMMMTMFGGMAKGERSRIRIRTRASMEALAATTDRHLGGRPPYGYMLVDAGPHPNPAKAASGQRAHKLAPDPVTSTVVTRIFDLYIAGTGFRGIADLLTAEGIPSPSQHDRARNSHRDPRGWSHSAVRAILANPTYSGTRVWGKQEKFERLLDLDDIAAGYETRMRWKGQEGWVRPAERTHEALVDEQTIAAVQDRLAHPGAPGSRKPRTTVNTYPMRGMLYCAACEHRMQAEKRPWGVLYRCDTRGRRSLPADLQHPKTVSVSADRLEKVVDDWIVNTLADPEWLASTQEVAQPPAGLGLLRKHLRDAQDKVSNLVSVIESGTISDAITKALAEREAQVADLKRRIADTSCPQDALSAEQVAELIERVGGMAGLLRTATPERKAEVYAGLGLRLIYNHEGQSLLAEALASGGVDKSCPEGDFAVIHTVSQLLDLRHHAA